MGFPPNLHEAFLQFHLLERGESWAEGRSTVGKGVYREVQGPWTRWEKGRVTADQAFLMPA